MTGKVWEEKDATAPPQDPDSKAFSAGLKILTYLGTFSHKFSIFVISRYIIST